MSALFLNGLRPTRSYNRNRNDKPVLVRTGTSLYRTNTRSLVRLPRSFASFVRTRTTSLYRRSYKQTEHELVTRTRHTNSSLPKTNWNLVCLNRYFRLAPSFEPEPRSRTTILLVPSSWRTSCQELALCCCKLTSSSSSLELLSLKIRDVESTGA